MPGGPINGVPWSATAGLGVASGASGAIGSAADDRSYTGIIVPTMLQMASDALSYWTSLTCLYDRYWVAEDETVTLPIALFHVKKISTTITKEVSKKRVILFEPEGNLTAADMADPLREGVMQTVVDNIVRNPKQYDLEVIIPFQPVGRYVTEGVKTFTDMVSGFSDLVGKDTPGGFTDWWEGIFSSVFALMKTANTAAEFAGKLPISNMDGGSYINMNSLEAMADSERVLCMKMWTGYDYKFVTVTNFRHEKNPQENNVFRGTLQLQEIPVLQITKPSSMQPNAIKRNWAVKAVAAVQGTRTRPLLWLTQIEEAANATNTGGQVIKQMLGIGG
jgi:hypothetical protein